jgi:hypothetical protein
MAQCAEPDSIVNSTAQRVDASVLCRVVSVSSSA